MRLAQNHATDFTRFRAMLGDCDKEVEPWILDGDLFGCSAEPNAI